ncbi:unnamed protein product [Lymnaea stagnalis]|uniref:Uncharacterized protein n=1 Tax=Lymnaea stagnalis TaxID=6523 RepID=A0AAV2GWW6_LYMST
MALPSYSDLNILGESGEKLTDIIDLSIELGFERVAVNNFVANLKGGKGKKQTEKIAVSPPSEILLNEKSLASLQLNGKTFEQLSRITVVLQDDTNIPRLGGSDIQAYDILAVQPTTEATFKLACQTLDIDIISFNFAEKIGFSHKRSLLNAAAKRGIYFEILYGPALINNVVKRQTISNAMSLVNVCLGKNIILSSGAEYPSTLRSPMDVFNLARLFGLSYPQAKDAISGNCRAVLKHAASRKTCKSVISVKAATALSQKEQWLLNKEYCDPDSSVEGDESEENDGDESEENDDLENDFESNEPKKKKIKIS